MRKTQIITYALIPVVLVLAYFLFASIKEQIDYTAAVKASESRVIERLKEIREAQKAFLLVNGRYTASWDSLVDFVSNGSIPIVQKREDIIQRTADKAYLGDSIRVSYDTLRIEKVRDYIFPADKFPNFKPERLPFVPGYQDASKTFSLSAGKIEQKGGIKLDVIEVFDPYPFDKTRSDKSSNRKRRLLRFGSMEEVSTTGNWED
jgi:hypothetical protein